MMRTQRARGPVALIAVVVLASVAAASASTPPAARAVRFLVEQQTASGAFGAIASADGVAEAAAALVAGGETGEPVGRARDHIARHGAARARETAGRAGRIVLGLLAAGADPRAHGGTDFMAILAAHYDEISGEFDHVNLYSNALAALAWVAAAEQLPERARTFIEANECPDGGFGWRTACAGRADVDTTAMTIMLLASAGGSEQVLARARGWLADARLADGGFGQPGQAMNANATGLALSAIVALGEDPRAAPWARSGTDPFSALLALQTSDGGFRYDASREAADLYATVQALPGIAGAAWPITAPASRAQGAAQPTTTARATPPPSRAAPADATEPSVAASSDAVTITREGPVVLGARANRDEAATDATRSAAPFAFAGLALSVAAGMLAARLVTRRRT